MTIFKKIVLIFLISTAIISCGDSSRVNKETFDHANLKYDCPVCKEKMALFCPDCNSDNLIWCQDGQNVNSIYCKDCKAIMYPMMYTCFSCEKNMRQEKTCYSSKTNENHQDCQSAIDAQNEFDQSMNDAQRELDQLMESDQNYDEY